MRDYRARYRAISQVLDANDEILTAVHRDLQSLSEGDSSGREGDYTSENILRALVVQHIEGLPFRETVIRIGGEPFLQDFLRMRKKPVMDYSFLDKCFLAIQPQTWRRVNELLGRYAVAQEAVTTNVIRTDTTVVESNIHYPTDASLLWDTWRVASRLLSRAREIDAEKRAAPLPRSEGQATVSVRHPLHAQQVGVAPAEGQGDLPHADRADGVDRGDCRGFLCPEPPRAAIDALAALAAELQAYLPSMETIVATAQRAQIDGEKVPASQRVFSLFEPHTELIKRGRRQKPVEFGHKVLLCESAEKFITDYEVYEKQRADCELTESVIDRHEKLFGARPEVVGGRQGLLSGRGEVPGIGRARGHAGHPSADARFRRQGVGALAGLSRGDRGHYFRFETRISADSLFLSRL